MKVMRGVLLNLLTVNYRTLEVMLSECGTMPRKKVDDLEIHNTICTFAVIKAMLMCQVVLLASLLLNDKDVDERSDFFYRLS